MWIIIIINMYHIISDINIIIRSTNLLIRIISRNDTVRINEDLLYISTIWLTSLGWNHWNTNIPFTTAYDDLIQIASDIDLM